MDLVELKYIAPLLIIAFGIVLSLLLVAWQRSQKLIMCFTFAIFCSALVASITLWLNPSLLPAQDMTKGVYVTSLLKIDNYSHYAFTLILLVSLVVTLLGDMFLTDEQRVSPQVHDEFFILLQLVVLGGGVLVASAHFASLFLGFELISIALVGLIGYIKTAQYSVESAFKYLVLSASASSFMLLGIAFIYSQTGSLSFSFDVLASQSGSVEPVHAGLGELAGFYQAGLVLFMVGIAFKLSLAPFHFWTPDVYQGSPTPVTLLLATVSKFAMFMVLLKFWFSQPYSDNSHLVFLVSSLALISMLVGNILALKQVNIKRLLAYSSIAHMGYVLMVLLILRDHTSHFSFQGALFYLSAYILATLALFMGVQLTHTQKMLQINKTNIAENSLTKSNFCEVYLSDWRGLFWKNSLLALLILISLLSLAGIPLSMGFIGKFYLLTIAIDAHLWWLITVFIMGSSIALFYYFSLIFVLFDKKESVEVKTGEIPLNFPMKIAVLSLVLLSVFLGIFPNALSQLISQL